MPDWLIGVLAPVGVSGILALVAALSSRYKFGMKCWKFGLWLRRLGLGYDIPIIGGESETKLKETIFSSVSDFFRLIARGIAGQSFEDK